MKISEVISGEAGLAGVQWALLAPPMRRALRRELSRMVSGECVIGLCRLRRAKYKPGRHLTAYYDVTLMDARSGEREVRPIEVTLMPQHAEDPRGAPQDMLRMEAEAEREGLCSPFLRLAGEVPEWGMRVQVSPLDVSFPQLVRVSTPAHVREILAAAHAMGNGAPKGEPANQYSVTTVRYRPDQRHVLRYDPQTGDNLLDRSRSGTVFAKLYRGERGARAMRVATAVTDWLRDAGPGLEAARPLAYLPADETILYPFVAGRPLSQVFRSATGTADRHLARIGSALQALHTSPGELMATVEPHDFGKEVKAIARASEHLDALLPATRAAITSILDRATEIYSRLPGEPPAFAHGDLKADHILVARQGLTLIDFDTCYLADPAIDIGKFLADLRWWYTKYRLPGVEQAQQVFLDGYFNREEGARLLRARVFESLILAKITVRRVRLFERDWASRTEQFVQAASAILDRTASAFSAIVHPST